MENSKRQKNTIFFSIFFYRGNLKQYNGYIQCNVPRLIVVAHLLYIIIKNILINILINTYLRQNVREGYASFAILNSSTDK